MTPVNLFTGVLSCGIFCFLTLWMDFRFLPSRLRMPIWLMILNFVSGIVFLRLGVKGYWDVKSRFLAVGGLLLLFVAGCCLAIAARGWIDGSQELDESKGQDD